MEAEHAALRAQVREVPGRREQVTLLTLLLGHVRDLAARLAKDSHTSGKPPPSDRLARKPRPRRTKSLRTPSGKKAGGQLDPRGTTLRLVATDHADAVVELRPAVWAWCHRELPPDAEVVRRAAPAAASAGPAAGVPRGDGASGAAGALAGLSGGQRRDVSRRGRAQPGAVRPAAAGLEQQAAEDIISVTEATVGEAPPFDPTGSFVVMVRDKTVFDAQDAFALSPKSPRPFAVVITQTGKATEKPLGIVTPWDLFGPVGAR